MATQGQDSSDITSLLAHRGAPDTNARQIAEAVVSTWHALDAALAPIIGLRGAAALYQRSVFVTSRKHAWLAALHEEIDGRIDSAALKSLFSQQRDDDAAAAAEALLQTFHELLASLVGHSLTSRLLRSVRSATPVPPSPDSQGSSP